MLSNPSFFTVISNCEGVIEKCEEVPENITDIEGSNIVAFFGNDIIDPFKKALSGKTTYYSCRSDLFSNKPKEVSVYLTPIENRCLMIISELPAKKVSKPLSKIAGGIANFFSKKLNEITGNTELLRMEKPNCPEIEKYSKEVSASVEEMSSITSKLLTYSRIGKTEPRRIKFDEYISSVISNFHMPAHIIFSTDLGSNEQSVLYEPEHIKTVVESLMKNAVESVNISGFVEISTKSVKTFQKRMDSDNFICLSVKDSGCGMSAKVINGMFNPFFSTKKQGRGLSLASVYEIVQNHNGWIDVKSNKGKGTTIKIFTPVYTKEVKAFEFKKEETKKSKGTILIVEDSQPLLEMTSIVLKKNHYEVLKAITGEDAVIILESSKEIDLVLLDINLPGISGFEVLDRFYNKISTKFIICSGYQEKKVIEDYKKRGISFLSKPFEFKALLGEIRKYLERRVDKRYGLKDGTFVLVDESLNTRGKIVDISLGGIAFHYKKNVFKTHGNSSISLGNDREFIDSIPFVFIADEKEKKVIRGRFGELNISQKYALNSFIMENSFQ
jgi:nitrogen-specific signal transduction histidine kinase/DNA-binding response OmpR family regulator